MYAIYLEFQNQDPADAFYQGLFIPSHMVGSYRSAPTYAYKSVSYRRPRRIWEVKQNKTWTSFGSKDENLEVRLGASSVQLGALTSYLRPVVSDPNWVAAGSFPVEVTTADLLSLRETPTRLPQALSSRIKACRDAAHFRPLPEVS